MVEQRLVAAYAPSELLHASSTIKTRVIHKGDPNFIPGSGHACVAPVGPLDGSKLLMNLLRELREVGFTSGGTKLLVSREVKSVVLPGVKLQMESLYAFHCKVDVLVPAAS